jgi:phenylpyruvate tautomerase PptA (4-oxalocrotonate tautomerase family)
MPTYVVQATSGRLNAEQRQAIAREITRAHSSATGAQGFFAQVIFNDIPTGCHFMGGAPIETDQIFVQGQIRAGRTSEQKKGLLDDIVASLAAITRIEKRYLWAYIADLPPGQMVEYGHVLPEPGGERAWLDSLPAEDRAYMLSFGER